MALPAPVDSWTMPEQVDWVLRQFAAGRQSQDWAKAQIVDVVRDAQERTRMVASNIHFCAS